MEEELDESLFFLELFEEFNPAHKDLITNLLKEGDELLRIIVATINTTRGK